MKTSITTLILAFVALATYAQCNFENLFPVNIGISKFDAINQISSNPNLKENILNTSKDVWNYWFKYNNGKDSAYVAALFYEYLNHPCLMGNRNTIKLSFVNDKLYKFLTILEFNKTEYNHCFNNYNSLVNALKTQFNYTESFYLTNRQTEEKTGEGLYLAKSPINYDNAKTKNVLVTITYNMDFDYTTGEPSGYNIRLTFEDKTNTIYEE